MNVYDSLHGRLDLPTKKIVADLVQSKENEIEILYADVQRQSGASDCGLFALAFATSVCYGDYPAASSYTQSEMREHLLSCIKKGQIVRFPQRAKRRPKKLQLNIFPFTVFAASWMMEQRWWSVQCAGTGTTWHACVFVRIF